MRPLELRLSHFGPYREPAVLNFEALDRLFLVCGPTGAGKTTLFDALTYALYEKTAGTRAQLSDQLVSHHAAEGSLPEVHLRFALGAQQWRVTRQLRHRVPKKKGEGWTEREPQVLLERLGDGGWEAIQGKRSEINQKLEDLLGLSADEFAKIVVLPQGDFQRFLEASTGDREKMLQKLFPVEAYDRLVDTLKARAKVVEEERRRWEDRWEELVRQRGTEEDDRPALEAAWAEATGASVQAAADEEAAAAHLTRLEGQHADWLILAKKREERDRLEAGRGPWEAARSRLEKARQARPLGADLDRWEAIKTEGQSLRAEQDKARAEHQRVESEWLAVKGREGQRLEREARLDQVLRERGVAEHQLHQWNEGQALRQAETQARTKEELTSSRWAEAQVALERGRAALQPPPAGPSWEHALAAVDHARSEHQAALAAAEVRQRHAELDAALGRASAEVEVAGTRCDTARSEERLWGEIVDALKAAALADTLVDNEPCPVCGSPSHPSPALWPETRAEAPRRWQAAQTERSEAEAALAGALARQEALVAQQAQLAAAPPEVCQPADTARVLENLQAHVAALSRWSEAQDLARRALEEAEKAEASVAAEHRLAAQTREGYTARVTALSGDQKGDPAPRLAALNQEETALRRQLETERKASETLGLEREALTVRIEGFEVRLVAQREDYRRLQADLEAAVAALGWNLDTLRSSRMNEGELTALETALAAYDRDVHRLDGETAALQSKFPDGPPGALDPARQGLDTLRARRAELESLAKEREFALRNRDRLEDELREVRQQKDSLEADFQKLVPLARALDGHNGLNLRLTTWVLVQALEQVAASATHRLASMSGGRYALKVQTRGVDARKDWGLDLAVIDGYTGQERAVGTLSGGEKFMTSISLALGLADVIQERSGGLKLEAIFIDEGFGTLDDQSLDRAMAILHDLGQHRSVGIISHVAELRQRISSRVEVVKGKNGSWLKVE